MKYLVLSIFLMSVSTSQTIFDFSKTSNIKNWRVIDDVVMGGRSSGNFKLSADGFGLFEGNISLENNGGFSSVRYQFDKISVEKKSKILLTVKGDKKSYQFRVKDKSQNYYNYISTFKTSGEWEEIEIPLKDMYPSFRGRKLDSPNFSHNQLEEIAFLIANKKNEQFKLLIDKIEIQ